MKIVIIEDERSAAENLKHLLNQVDSGIVVDSILDTITGAVDYFREERNLDLAFFDIHLADGLSFDIFDQVKVKTPIIFTTAYDEYALKAFKVNSIDYLLKPIIEEELIEALDKFKRLRTSIPQEDQLHSVLQKIAAETKKYRSSFLVQQRDTLIPLSAEQIAYFTIDTGRVKAYCFNQSSYFIDEKLEDLEASLDPREFFRANRQFIVQRNAVQNLTIYFNGKLILNLEPRPAERIIISKAKAPQFKEWLNQNP